MTTTPDVGAAALNRDGPLTGIKVIDLGAARAGPVCVRNLADLGADVLQVCPPTGHISFASRGADGMNLHRNKRSMIIDLASIEGRDVFMRLVQDADVLVENFRPGVKYRLRIAPDDIWAVNPRVVYASLSGFGQDGPYADRPAVDQVVQAFSGLMSVTGPPGAGPWRAGAAVSDLAAGNILTQGVLAALFARQRTGRGQWVRTSLIEAMLAFMEPQTSSWLIDGEVPVQAGNEHPTMPGMNVYATTDGYVSVAAGSAFDEFCARLDMPEVARDPRFADEASRLRHRNELNETLADAFRRYSNAECLERLATFVSIAPVLSMDQVFEDAQIRHLEVTARVNDVDGRVVEVLRSPLTFSDTPTGIARGVPAAGGDTLDVLEALGYRPEEIQSLLQSGAVATAPRS